MTAGELIKMITENGIHNIDVSAQDVARSINIWGKELANLKGKTTSKKPPVVTYELNEEEKIMLQRKQVLYIDLLFVNGCTYLIGLYSPSEYLEIMRMTSRSNNEMLKALKKMFSYMQKCG